jgi:hypothetical protein
MKNSADFRPFSERPRIPIGYNGQVFRSKTEARWAAFFDMIGRPYRYEAVGYPVNGGAQWCVPDFVLPEPRRPASHHRRKRGPHRDRQSPRTARLVM